MVKTSNRCINPIVNSYLTLPRNATLIPKFVRADCQTMNLSENDISQVIQRVATNTNLKHVSVFIHKD